MSRSIFKYYIRAMTQSSKSQRGTILHDTDSKQYLQNRHSVTDTKTTNTPQPAPVPYSYSFYMPSWHSCMQQHIFFLSNRYDFHARPSHRGTWPIICTDIVTTHSTYTSAATMYARACTPHHGINAIGVATQDQRNCKVAAMPVMSSWILRISSEMESTFSQG